jgi:hypothetical protein
MLGVDGHGEEAKRPDLLRASVGVGHPGAIGPVDWIRTPDSRPEARLGLHRRLRPEAWERWSSASFGKTAPQNFAIEVQGSNKNDPRRHKKRLLTSSKIAGSEILKIFEGRTAETGEDRSALRELGMRAAQ